MDDEIPDTPPTPSSTSNSRISSKPTIVGSGKSSHKQSAYASSSHPSPSSQQEQRQSPKRLILCFDGTAESFEGNSADSNVVKLYSKFDRTDANQLHYYQPGVGTYPANGYKRTPLLLGSVWNKIVQLLDQAFAVSFNSHVMNGYRFLLRYYEQGDLIYIFGFSRGAFIARFLARFISQVGLLARGSEQLVPFAYSNFLDYELGTGRKDIKDYLEQFTKTFCRHYNQDYRPGEILGVHVYFLGLFDTVNSISIFELSKKPIAPPKVHGTAKYIRHAVAVDEARVKFKPALLVQDQTVPGLPTEDVKEVWFPGGHTDIGGGVRPDRRLQLGRVASMAHSLGRLTGFGEDVRRRAAPRDTVMQLSDIALKWMIDELDCLPEGRIKWNGQKDVFLENYRRHTHQAVVSRIHNALAFSQDKPLETLLWRIGEILPIRRWQYSDGAWHITRVPNLGRARDIPPNAVFHGSTVDRLEYDGRYHPTNNVWVGDNDKPVKLDAVDASIVKDKHPHPFATSKDRASLPKQGSLWARFRLYSAGNKAIQQDDEDNTYCVVESTTKSNSHTSEATSTIPPPVWDHAFIH